jgi:glucose/arabinose dehydrogenase
VFTAGGATAAPPSGTPTIFEPSMEGQIVSPEDVHMEAKGFADPDGDTHACSDWEIWSVSPLKLKWQALCASGTLKVHIHLGDGVFTTYADDAYLKFDTDYKVRVRFHDSAGEVGAWAERRFRTGPAGPPGTPGPVPWAVREPGFRVELVASGLQLPVDIAPVLWAGTRPRDPMLYVTELYGQIKVITRSGKVRTYAKDLLNFDPTGDFPGSGEMGVTGIAVDPLSGDVFASMVYEDTSAAETPRPHYAEVVRFHSVDGGRTAATQEAVIDLPEPQGPSHQISAVTIGPDRKLYVHTGDSDNYEAPVDLGSFLGKVLRMNVDGSAAADNPFYDASDGITARDYVYAYGFRNPFGAAWRAADDSLYTVENGPAVDRFARVVRGRNYSYDGSNDSMRKFALYNWDPSHAPTSISFVQPETAGGSGFPPEKMDHAFVAESGPTYATGPQFKGKRIVEFAPDSDGRYGAAHTTLVEYTGVGKATVLGLATGLDGLYFTDLYKDVDFTTPIDRGANVWRVRDTTKPVLSNIAFRLRSGRLKYKTSEAATVSGRVQHARSRKGPRRTRWVALRPKFVDVAAPGVNRFRLPGRLRRSQLEQGRYRLFLRAGDAAGNRSRPKRTRFRIRG